MQRINFTETTLTTLTRNARCSFANAVYKLTMKAQQGLKCDDLFKKSVLMNEVNKLLCKYKLDECISFHPYQEAGISTWAFGVGDISPYIWEIYLTINDVVTLIGEGTDLAEIAIDINANTETTGVSAELSEDGDYMTVYSPPGCFVKGDLIKTSDRPGALPQSLITFLAGKCPQVETCVDYTEEELNCIAPQDLQLIFEFTHRYKETLAKSTKRVTSPSTSSSSSSASDCCNWGSIGGSIGNQSDLVAYLNTIEKNLISVYDETTEITGDLKSLKFLGAGVTATNSGGNVSVTIPGGGGGGGFECADLEGCNISLLTNDAGYLTDISATNGLTEDPANNFKLGGTLIEDTTISQGGYLMRFEGSAAAKLDYLVTIDKIGGTGSGLFVNSDKLGVLIDSVGTGLNITSDSSPLAGNGTLGSTLTCTNNLSNSQVSILNLYKSINTTSAVNSGVFISMFPGADSGSSSIQSSDISCLVVNATQPNVQSKLVLKPQGTSTGLYGSALETYGSGKLQLPAYGKKPSNFPGTPNYLLGVDGNGDVIEITSNTFTFKQVISSSDIKNGTAVNLITAPGAGKAICITEASIQLTGTTAYAGATGVFAIYNSTSGTLLKSMFNSGTNTFFQTNTGSTTELYKLIDTSTNAGNLSKNMVVNEGVDAKVFWTIGPMSSGNVGVTVYGSYRIIDL
jgi:hypothetical protein